MSRRSLDPVKRAIDIAIAIAGLALTSPVLLMISIAVLSTAGRPIVFAQDRSGRLGRPFRIVKFRTMRPLGPGERAFADDAQRITRLGRVLRSSSLDELPTLWNVLKGEMSLVGPRPLPPHYLLRYTADQARRLEVTPGITGWAQIHGRNATSWDERFALDVWYVDHRSLSLDVRIFVRTLGLVLMRRGISHVGHVTMPEYMGPPSAPTGVDSPNRPTRST
jgi:lipopolysaccharide/colanic/teichoic acid biosynthesis glycosyltransferase